MSHRVVRTHATLTSSLVRRVFKRVLPRSTAHVGLDGGCAAFSSGREAVVLPSPYDAWIHRHVETQELTVEAGVTGDRAVALEAFTLDPLAGRGDLLATEAMVDELLAATAEWLPQFARS